MSLSHVDQRLLRGLEGRSDPNSLQYISREAAYQELQQRTGQDFGFDVEKWRDYLQQSAQGFPASVEPPNEKFPLVGTRNQKDFPADCWLPAKISFWWRTAYYPLADTGESVRQWHNYVQELANAFLAVPGQEEHAKKLTREMENDVALIAKHRPDLV